MEQDRIPEGLYEIIKQNKKSSYRELITEKAKYPYLYHLSEIRCNLVDWLPIVPGMRVLERNAECGALTGRLLSRAGQVTAVTDTARQAGLIRERFAGMDGLTVLTGEEYQSRYGDAAAGGSYDVIVLVGDFYRYAEELPRLRALLAPQGKLFVADANRIGLKYLAGCQEEYRGGYFTGIENYKNASGKQADGGTQEAGRCYTRKEYEARLLDAGFSQCYFYYPYPDYKFPSCIYSDDYLPKKGELSDNRRNFDRDRIRLFEEREAFDTMISEGLFGEFSNSFLIEAGNGGPVLERTIYARYSNERDRRFEIRTDITVCENGEKQVLKSALHGEGAEHIGRIRRAYEKLSECYRNPLITFCPCEAEGDAARFLFVPGKTLQELLEEAVQCGDMETVRELIRDYIARVSEDGGKEKFVPTPEFAAVFGERHFDDEAWCAEVSDIDMIFSNIIIPPVEGVSSAESVPAAELPWTVIDYEWSFFFPVPKKFILYRAMYFACYQILNDTEITLGELMREAGISDEQQKVFASMEEHFQAYLAGDMVPVRNMQRLMGTKITELCDLLAGAAGEAETEEKRARVRGIRFHIDRKEYQDGSVVCCGWAFAATWDGRYLPVHIHARDEGGRMISAEITRSDRKDVARVLRLRRARDTEWGFNCVFVAPREMKWKLVFSLGRRSREYCSDSIIK